MGRPKKITFTKDELNAIGNNLQELTTSTIKDFKQEIRKIERDLRQASTNLQCVYTLLNAIIDIQEYLIGSKHVTEEKHETEEKN